MDRLMPHLILAPIALPLLTAGLMLLLREERQRTKVTLNITSTLVGLVVAGLQTLPIGTDPVPLPGSSTTPSPSSSTPTTNKSTGVGVPELTDSALYRQTLSGTCPKPVKTISSRSQYQQQVDDLLDSLGF